MSLKAAALSLGLLTGAPNPGVSQDPLAHYMREARTYERLSHEDEIALGTAVQTEQDPKAVNDLVRANLRLVVKMAHKYKGLGLPLEDLVQEGNVGLLEGARRYDPSKGTRFSTYAGYWIRAYILRSLMDNKRMVRIGKSRAQRTLFYNLRKIEAELGAEATPEEIAKVLGVKAKAVVDMQIRLGSPEVSLETPVGDDEGTFGDFQASPYGNTETAVVAGETRDNFRALAEQFSVNLKGRERQIWDERLMADKPATLQDLGSQWGVSRERVRQIEAKLVSRLRQVAQAA